MTVHTRRAYGIASELYIVRKPNTDAYVVGGVAEDLSRWTRVLSSRAAYMLWFHLARLLLPEKVEEVTAVFNTAPLRSDMLPTIANHCTVESMNEFYLEIAGWTDNHSWSVFVTNEDASQLWTALDKLLFPEDGQSA